ncbi:MAG: sulfotransferase [Anaerolineae bacterium]|nr:sulfotransferase [Anaerolineae bacterium]
MNKKNLSNTIILAGSGRSGTTWLGNIIAANPNMRILFEPFDYRRVPEAKVLPLLAYARPTAPYPEWFNFVYKALAGQIGNEWINQQGTRKWAWKRLVKAIRVNMMLGWIDKNFKPKIVFTTRHPCAVILSRLKLDWDPHIDIFLEQKQLTHDYLSPYMDIILGAQTEVEKQAVGWCIENLVPLRQLPQHNWTFCTYEDLYRNPQKEADRILSDLNVQKTWFTKRAINKVSMVTRPDSAVFSQQDPLSAWKHQLSKQDIDTILTIVQSFQLTLYDEDILPHKPLSKDTPKKIST